MYTRMCVYAQIDIAVCRRTIVKSEYYRIYLTCPAFGNVGLGRGCRAE